MKMFLFCLRYLIQLFIFLSVLNHSNANPHDHEDYNQHSAIHPKFKNSMHADDYDYNHLAAHDYDNHEKLVESFIKDQQAPSSHNDYEPNEEEAQYHEALERDYLNHRDDHHAHESGMAKPLKLKIQPSDENGDYNESEMSSAAALNHDVSENHVPEESKAEKLDKLLRKLTARLSKPKKHEADENEPEINAQTESKIQDEHRAEEIAVETTTQSVISQERALETSTEPQTPEITQSTVIETTTPNLIGEEKAKVEETEAKHVDETIQETSTLVYNAQIVFQTTTTATTQQINNELSKNAQESNKLSNDLPTVQETESEPIQETSNLIYNSEIIFRNYKSLLISLWVNLQSGD